MLAVTDRADGAQISAEVFGKRLALVPYIMPGFALAKSCAEIYAANPDVEGLALLKHGIFTFGATARESYERMIDAVTLAERHLAAKPPRGFAQVALPNDVSAPEEIAPIVRGLVASPPAAEGGEPKRVILCHRSSPAILDYVGGAELERYGRAGPVTPDHVIRTKPWPLILPAPRASGLAAFRAAAEKQVADYVASYRAYFDRYNTAQARPRIALDPMPLVVLVPGVGLFGVGKSAKDAATAADLAETTIGVVAATEAHAKFESIPERDVFDMEYWSLEQAKLGKAAEKPLARHVAVVTGGASGIGRATAKALSAEGAEVCVLDLNATDGAIACDVTDAASVRHAFREVVARHGGVDIVVSNAGAAWQGRIGEVDEAVLRKSFELNFWSHQRVAQAAVAVMRAQKTGGCLLFNVSKQALNPGLDFGPYGLPKAATFALMRQYAIDHGAEGIRADAVNADRIRTGLLSDRMIAERSKARGVSERDYMSGNLLGREVTGDDVARAFVSLALARSTTGAVVTVDGGNIAAAPR